MEKNFIKNVKADKGRQILRTSLSFEKSLAGQTLSTILEVKRREDFEARMQRLVQIADEQETVRLWLLQKSKHTKQAYARVVDELVQFFQKHRRRKDART